MKEDSILNPPNAGKVIEALRSVGYENVSALADLVDNSLDAQANNIIIQIKPTSNDYELFIADDGKGMNKEVLDEALKLGSDTEHAGDSDLGKFGMGLVTASLSIAKRIQVITKSIDGVFLTSIQDVDEIKKKNSFVKQLRESSTDEVAVFKSFLNNARSGTLLILSKCDQIQDKNIDNLHKTITNELGQIFRLFIQSGKKINVAGKIIPALDPLMIHDKETIVLSDDTFSINTPGGKEKVRIKMVLLPNRKTTDIGPTNIPNQGFYVMRNNREISGGITLGVFNKHNQTNRFRGEIYFNSRLDKEMRIDFTKRDLKPMNEIMKEIIGITKHQIDTIKKEAVRDNVRQKDKEDVHRDSAKSIAEKSNLLIKPDIEIEKRAPRGDGSKPISKTLDTRTRVPLNVHEVKSNSVNVQFIVRNMGTGSQLFEVDQIGKITQITYNADHPFYSKVFIENDNNAVKEYVDYMVFSLAVARQKVFDDDQLEKIDTYMNIFSSNLRILMA